MQPSKETLIADFVEECVTSRVYSFTTEEQLQSQLYDQLRGAGLQVEREVIIDARNRIDLAIGEELGIEVKSKWSIERILEQLQRYAASGKFKQLMLITSRRAHVYIKLYLKDLKVPTHFVLVNRSLR